jgi:cobalt-zinc-cadmium efflux system outer membrane protein
MRIRSTVVVLLVAAACARIRPDAGLDDVERLVTERTDVRLDHGAAPAGEQLAALLDDPLTVERAVEIALVNNRRLRALYGRLGIAEADLVQAGLPPNPVLHAGVRFAVEGPGPGVEASLLADFLSILQIPLKKRVAGAAFEAAQLEVASAVVALAADVKVAFYTLQGAEQMLELRQTVAHATALSAELARRQHAAGNIPDLDLASEQALFEEERLALSRAEEEALADREELNVLLGLWGPHTAWTIARRLPELPANERPAAGLESLAVAKRLDLARAWQEAHVQSHTWGLTRLYGLIPGAGAAAERELEGAWSVGPAVEIALPIFDQRQAAVASAATQTTQSIDRHAALAVEIRAHVRRARTRMVAARARAEHHHRVLLPLRRRILVETQRQYNAMLAGPFQLLQAKRDEIEAGRGYVEALTEYWVARSELERELGCDLTREGPSS